MYNKTNKNLRNKTPIYYTKNNNNNNKTKLKKLSRMIKQPKSKKLLNWKKIIYKMNKLYCKTK